jgi:hypothetical protein
MWKKKKKEIERICGNCRLYSGDAEEGRCKVVILHEGQQINLPVSPSEPCFFDQPYFDPITGEEETFNDIKEIKMWVEDDKGRKTAGNGTVKIEYPEELLPEGFTPG